MAFFRFTAPGLSDAMNCALTYLIERGGQHSAPSLARDARQWATARRYDVRVTDATIDALRNRGMIKWGRRTGVAQYQITDTAINLLCKFLRNEHPVPVMTTAVWEMAHSEYTNRRRDGKG